MAAKRNRRPLQPKRIQPTYTPVGADPDEQAEALTELRELAIAAVAAREALCSRVYELAAGHTVSRPDMARATGYSRPWVDQIIARGRDTAAAKQG